MKKHLQMRLFVYLQYPPISADPDSLSEKPSLPLLLRALSISRHFRSCGVFIRVLKCTGEIVVVTHNTNVAFLLQRQLFRLFKGGFHDSAHVRESKFFSSPLHAVARTQATSFNCYVNEPVGSKLLVKVSC